MSAGWRKSITFRLTLLFAAVSTTVLLLLGLLVGTLVERHFEELDMELLTGKIELLQSALRKVDSNRGIDALSAKLDESLVGHHGLAVAVLSAEGRTLYATAGAQFPDDIRTRAKRGLTSVWTDAANRSYRGVFAEARIGDASLAPAVVAVSTELSHHQHFMHSFKQALWSVMAAAALLTGLLGWFAARRGLAPLREIRQRAAEITAARLDQRLPVDAIPAELAEVAATLNEMLARLQDSFRRLSDFSSDLAHELRTPVANLLTQTQVTLSRSRTLAEYNDVLASNVEEFERLSRMIADMLLLAKSDNDLIVPHREPVDLPAEIRGLAEFYDALLDEKGIRLSCAGAGLVSGDRLMLRRALSNLLSNAIRHTPAGGHIAIRVAADEAALTLSVENSGLTIPQQHLPRLFDRFYRVDASRRRFGEGAGLGLAITRSIARAHGGDASVRSERGLTTFEIRLPLRP